MRKLDVSIIIPVYCRTHESLDWLGECLRSATKQNCKVIVYDDGSPQPVDTVISKFKVTHLVGDRNNGVSYARNKAIEFADTDCVLPLDCDDRLVDSAVDQLYAHYVSVGRIPVYPDVSKFGIENDPHYVLLDFDCSHITNYVGFSSVNVLHSKEQWRTVGGYDPDIEFYEDGEYNARLFGTYCGAHLPLPLVEYRMHADQRTKLYESESRKYALTLLERIRRYTMACAGCGGKRRTPSNVPAGTTQQAISKMATMPRETVAITIDVNNAPTHLPLEFDGKVLAVYVGGNGRGKHYYQGPVTKTPHKVSYGDYVYVDPRDARVESDSGKMSLFVRVQRKPEPAPIPTPPAPPAPAPVVEEAKPVEEPPAPKQPEAKPERKPRPQSPTKKPR